MGKERKRSGVRNDDFRAEARRLLGHVLQGAHHAVDLGAPGVGRDQKAHQAALSPTAASTSVLLSQAVSCLVSAHRISSKEPS